MRASACQPAAVWSEPRCSASQSAARLRTASQTQLLAAAIWHGDFTMSLAVQVLAAKADYKLQWGTLHEKKYLPLKKRHAALELCDSDPSYVDACRRVAAVLETRARCRQPSCNC